MFKKIFCFGILFIMVFSLAACSQGLTAYKKDAKRQIESYANAKGEDNYSKDGWAAICNAVVDGKNAVEAATNKSTVNTAVEDTKEAIDAVEYGAFCSLQKAFDNGWLTTDELQSIAYYYYEESIYHDHSDDEQYTPIPKNPLTLSNETQNAIKQAYLDELKERASDATLENVQIAYYFGTYRDCIIIGVSDNYFEYDYLFIPEYYIGEVLFRSYSAQFVQVWKAE